MGNQSVEAHEAIKSSSVLNCIDLSNPDVNQSVNLLKQACLDSGFFYVVNHGISQEFMDEVFAQSKRFFSLPPKEKIKLLRNEKHRGYTPVLDELLDPENQVHGDYKEGYYIGVEVAEDDPESKKPFYGPNQWPVSDILPGWRETMEKYHQEALEVGKAVGRIIALALDLDANFFDKREMLGEPIATLRLLHYEGQISNPLKGLYGAGAHTDYGLITLLATDDVPGLQICKDRDAKPQVWEDVAPLKGESRRHAGAVEQLHFQQFSSLLEFYGSLICVLVGPTGGYHASLIWTWCRSTLHRVLGNGQERYSIAYFLEPSHDCLVECLPTCQSESNPSKFPPILCRDYLIQRYKDTHADLNIYNKQ